MTDLTYAIGDIHGRFDLLEKALRWIEDHSRSRGPVNIVFLGDYIDRGPQTRQVIERLMEGPLRPSDTFICLMGNHEDMLLRALSGRDDLVENWLHNGGKETLASYGGSIPRSHIEWIETLSLSFEDEHRFFVHAGLNPKRELHDQTRYDMLWIRERFLLTPHDFGKHVVHGHTPQDGKPEREPYRTNLDTGAIWTGKLCIALFDPMQAGGPIQTVLIAE